ncbi:MAG: phage holin family protein [Chitinophagaceae bacterium]
MEKKHSEFFAQYRFRLISYINNLVLLGKLQVASKMSKLVSMFVIWTVVAILVSLVVLFGSFCAAYFFSDLFDSNIKGFGLVALIYIVFALIILFVGRNAIKKFISNQITSIIFEQTADDDDKTED